ncbi:bacterial membrane protein YfhO [Secundilactobacillus kimchicus JCM 15530]|uniref:Bacterial membrane protein YfhO n=2 Tax=Secundilactobacillus kimchicus TaxID=528209 RepID=A0A0R1HXD5_9LACO|nr:bacterial membrane protein YfhO [Secundilactobacillus kimchicus JCM 15530]
MVSRETFHSQRRSDRHQGVTQDQRLTGKRFWLIAAILSLVAVTALFLILGLAPFGPHNLAMSDMGSQYTQFFLMLRRAIVQHAWSPYSFTVGIGDSVIPIYTYYLMSPLNLLILAFPASHILTAINLIIFTKLVLASLSMTVLLTYKYNHRGFFTIGAGLAYSLSGFVAMNFYDLMWLDAVVLFPLIILGLERLFDNHIWGYLITLTATIVINYYMGYQTCLFVVFYFIYLLIRRKTHDDHSTGQYFKQQWPTIRRFIGLSALAGLLSAVVLLPTVFAMLSTGKNTFSAADYQLAPTFGGSALAGLGIGTTNFEGHLVHNPAVFVGLTFVVALLTFFLAKRVTSRAKWTGGGLLLVVILFMGLRPLNTIWHMFQMPAGFPFRMSYILSFVIIALGYEGAVSGAFNETRRVLMAGVGTAVLLSVGYWFANHPLSIDQTDPGFETQFMVSNNNYWLSLGAIVVATLLIALIGRQIKIARPLIVVFVGLEMVTNFVLATATLPFGNEARFSRAYTRSEAATNQRQQSGAMLAADTGDDSGFYRVGAIDHAFSKAFPQAYSGYNDAMTFDYAGASSYSSTLNSHTLNTMRNLGFFSRNERRISFQGSSAPAAQLLGLKYLFRVGEKPAVTTLLHRASLGYMVNDQLADTQLRPGDVLANLNRLLQGSTGRQNQFMQAAKVHLLSTSQRRGYRYQLKVTAATSGPQYLYIKDINVAEVTGYRDGERFSSDRHTPGNVLMGLGRMKAGQTTRVTLTSVHPLRQLSQSFAGLDQAAFTKWQQTIAKHQLKLRNAQSVLTHGANLTGEVTVGSTNRLLMVSVPYDKGWQVTVDGTAVATTKVMDGLLGVHLTPGQHQVTLQYRPQGLLVGGILTLVGLCLVVLMAGVRVRRVASE